MDNTVTTTHPVEPEPETVLTGRQERPIFPYHTNFCVGRTGITGESKRTSLPSTGILSHVTTQLYRVGNKWGCRLDQSFISDGSLSVLESPTPGVSTLLGPLRLPRLTDDGRRERHPTVRRELSPRRRRRWCRSPTRRYLEPTTDSVVSGNPYPFLLWEYFRETSRLKDYLLDSPSRGHIKAKTTGTSCTRTKRNTLFSVKDIPDGMTSKYL